MMLLEERFYHTRGAETRVFFAAMNIAARAVVKIHVSHSAINMVSLQSRCDFRLKPDSLAGILSKFTVILHYHSSVEGVSP